jgi:hypothetical protein
MSLDYNLLKRKIQDDLEVAKTMARKELAIEKISKKMKRAARRRRNTLLRTNNQSLGSKDVDELSPKQSTVKATDDSKPNAVEFISSSSKRERRNSLLQSKLRLDSEGFEVLNEFSED